MVYFWTVPTGNSPGGQGEGSFIERARRAQIVDAAARVVARDGYASASLARIAEDAGISKGVVTYHFTGKDEILRMVATRCFERAWQHMEGRIDEQRSAATRVRAWVGAELEFFGAHRTEFLAMSEVVVNHRAPDGSHAFADELDEEVDALAEILAHGQRDGEFRDFDARSVANIILRCLDGVLGSWALDPSVDLRAQSAALLDFIDHAIRTGPR